MAKRRLYEVEGAIELWSANPYVFRPAELYQLREDQRRELEDHNIYLIVKRPRISLIPDSLLLDESDQTIQGAVRIHLPQRQIEAPFLFSNPLPQAIIQLSRIPYPYSHLRFITLDGEPGMLAVHDVLRCSRHELGSELDFFVEYVGQGFGKGDRDAVDRLIGKSGKHGHSALQRVLADTNLFLPDCEVYVLLYSYKEYTRFVAGGGNGEPRMPPDEDSARFDRLFNAEISRKNRIDLVEAALIRYFHTDRYNELYVETFPRENHEILERLFELDITALSVSLSTEEHGVRTFSHRVAPRDWHIAQYPISNEKDRATFFDLLQPLQDGEEE